MIVSYKNKSSEKKFINFSTFFSHLGFGLLIFFISLNSILSLEKILILKLVKKRALIILNYHFRM